MSLEKLIEYAEMDNIADNLNEKTLKELGEYVCKNYKNDEDSRSEWKQRQEKAQKLAAQVVEKKTTPWPGAANVKFPLLTEAAVQFNARAYPALIPNMNIVNARVIGEDPTGEKLNSAIRVSRHMSFQLLEIMEEWEEEMDSLLMALPILGCMFKKTYYDPMLKRNKSELIYPKDLVVEYYTKNINEAYRITHKLSMTRNELREMALLGVYKKIEFSDEVPESDRMSQILHGTSAPEVNDATPRDILEMHTYYDLDGDGLAEPYIITVDLKSEQVLRVYACYDPDDILADEDGIIKVPMRQYFTKYGFIPNPDGSFYDLGFGHLLSPINDTVDTTINQLLDAGTLSIRQSGFLSRGIRLKQGNYKFKPGEWKVVNSTGDDLNKGIVPLPTNEPSGVLFNLLGMMVTSGQRLASTIDSQVGENPGQNQKATTTMAVMEAGAKVFNAIHKRCLRALKSELRKLFLLNGEHLDAQEAFNVIDPQMDINVFMQVAKEDYNADNLNIIPAADPTAPTLQMKLAKAMGLMELLPTGLINEVEAVRRMLEAQEQPGVDSLLKQPQPPQPDLELQFKMMESERNFRLEMLKLQQQDVTIQTNAILALAKAEAEEEGFQLEVYKAQLEELKIRSEAISKQAAEADRQQNAKEE